MEKEELPKAPEEEYKVTKEDWLYLQRMKILSDEDKQNLRLKNIKLNNRQIVQIRREIKFKEDQIKKKESLEAHHDFVDGKKPMFFLQNEIENSQANIEQLEEQIKGAQEEYDKVKGE